jgi:RimJ/RimL family protein N-acetyltransferase
MRGFQADVAPRHQKQEASSMGFDIRQLREDQPALYREIRLEALRLHPDAFGASFENEAARPLEFFADRLAGNAIFAGFQDGSLLGTAGFMRETGAKREHKGMLWGMYVRLEGRGTGLARRLVDAVVEHARDRVDLIHLSVVADNVVARRLYASFGFEAYGVETRSLKVDGRYLDEILMVKMLSEPLEVRARTSG